MSTARLGHNERGFPMPDVLTQFTITDVAPGFWRVTFSNPPVNLEDPDTIFELQELVGRMEADDALRVVVLESADDDFFINHYDVSRAAETPVDSGPTGLPTWIDTATRLASTSVVTIAKIRGRNRGGGSEVALACDLRFASREKALFGQPEVGAGMFPGGGALERLPLLVGRARALEIILGSDDFDAETAAQYGWINRAIPDHELADPARARGPATPSGGRGRTGLRTLVRALPGRSWWGLIHFTDRATPESNP